MSEPSVDVAEATPAVPSFFDGLRVSIGDITWWQTGSYNLCLGQLHLITSSNRGARMTRARIRWQMGAHVSASLGYNQHSCGLWYTSCVEMRGPGNRFHLSSPCFHVHSGSCDSRHGRVPGQSAGGEGCHPLASHCCFCKARGAGTLPRGTRH
jgi:hypothetical protein